MTRMQMFHFSYLFKYGEKISNKWIKVFYSHVNVFLHGNEFPYVNFLSMSNTNFRFSTYAMIPKKTWVPEKRNLRDFFELCMKFTGI